MVSLLAGMLACAGEDGAQPAVDARPARYCDALTPCTEAGFRYCDLTGQYPASEGQPNTCIPDPQLQGCSTAQPCTSEEAPYCTTSGECVACLNFSHCSTQTPVCSLSTHTCGACRSGTEGNQVCAAIDPLQPFCSELGACVECLANTDCAIISAGICDLDEGRCRGCVDSAECETGTCNTVNGVCEQA